MYLLSKLILSFMSTSRNLKKPKKQQTSQQTNKNQNSKPKQEENPNKKSKRQITKPKIIQITKEWFQVLNPSDGWDLSFTFPQKIDFALATFTCQKYTVLIECLLLLAVNKSQVSVYQLTKETHNNIAYINCAFKIKCRQHIRKVELFSLMHQVDSKLC